LPLSRFRVTGRRRFFLINSQIPLEPRELSLSSTALARFNHPSGALRGLAFGGQINSRDSFKSRLKLAAFVGAAQTNAADRVSRACQIDTDGGRNVGRDYVTNQIPFSLASRVLKACVSIGASLYSSRHPPPRAAVLFRRARALYTRRRGWPLLSSAFSTRARIKAPTMTFAQLNVH